MSAKFRIFCPAKRPHQQVSPSLSRGMSPATPNAWHWKSLYGRLNLSSLLQREFPRSARDDTDHISECQKTGCTSLDNFSDLIRMLPERVNRFATTSPVSQPSRHRIYWLSDSTDPGSGQFENRPKPANSIVDERSSPG